MSPREKNKELKNISDVCAACAGKGPHRVAFRGPLRSGRWGSWTTNEHDVLECQRCGLQWLASSAAGGDFYESNGYHEAFGLEAGEPGLSYLRDHAKLLPGKTLVDVGAGNGEFLRSVKDFCRETIAVEPSEKLLANLAPTNLSFSSLTGLADSEKRADLATAFNVIEHVEDPFTFLKEIRACLEPGGRLFLVTPNADDLLLRMAPEAFSRYFYRTAHRFYFRAPALEQILARAGFQSVRVEFRHRYGKENLLGWLKQHAPPGKMSVDAATKAANPAYRAEIEKEGSASHIFGCAVAGNG